jgi:colicin import membrane protein
MKSLLLFILLLLINLTGFSQSKKDLQAQVIALNAEKQNLITEKQKLMDDILNLKQEIIDLKTDILTYKSENEQLRTQLTSNNNASAATLNAVSSTQKTITTQTSSGRCQAITAKGTQCSRSADAGSKYCWQHKKTYEPGSTATSTNKSSSTSTGNNFNSTYGGKTIMTGPRGGKYYINSKGNKTYIKK